MCTQPAAACLLTLSGPANVWGSLLQRELRSHLRCVPGPVKEDSLPQEGGKKAQKLGMFPMYGSLLESETKTPFFLDSFLPALKSQTSMGNRI